MPRTVLDPDGRRRLDDAATLANGSLSKVDTAVREVIKDLDNFKNRARWNFLRNQITRLLRNRIKSKIARDTRKDIAFEKMMNREAKRAQIASAAGHEKRNTVP